MKKATIQLNAVLLALALGLAPASSFADASLSPNLEYRFPDGVTLRVHHAGDASEFPAQVLDAAVAAYQTITEFEGFDTPGYSFAEPDRRYAYDGDRVIDIYLGDPAGENQYPALGPRNAMFKDAPCFDAIPAGGSRYEAVILLPSNYRDFIRNWEKINPSPLGGRNVHVDLRGTLIHEMLHTVIFYYNKNLNKSERAGESSKELDWYVEGLARYFETFAGARHDFFSQGFKQTLPDRIRFSRGGSNYFMRYPDQAFTRLRYENALFWRFIDHRYGMDAIEALSRSFREEGGLKKGLEKVTGESFDRLLQRFALAVLEKDFGLKDDAAYLNDVARTQLRVENGVFYLLDGAGNGKRLGKICATDWIGRWADARAAFGEPSVAGDASESADVSAWATDFHEITLDAESPALFRLTFSHQGEGAPLYVQLQCHSRGGTVMQKELKPLARGRAQSVDLGAWVRRQGLAAQDIAMIRVLVSNSDTERTAPYAFSIEA